MRQYDLNRIQFYTKEDMIGGSELKKGELILRDETKLNFPDINDVLERYNLKKYIDNELYLKSWTPEDIRKFQQKAIEYGKLVGQFFATINNENVIELYNQVIFGYIHSFWEIVNNQGLFKQISKENFTKILDEEPDIIRDILTHKKLVEHYNVDIRAFLLTYLSAAEILLSFYEVEKDYDVYKKHIPKSLTIADKEDIISRYLDSTEKNLNFISLIENVRNKKDFSVSDKLRLKAKRIYQTETEKLLDNQAGMTRGVSIVFDYNTDKIKDLKLSNKNGNYEYSYTYSFNFITRHINHPYVLFQNFQLLFEFVDRQNRIMLVSKKSELGLLEKITGAHSQHEYQIGFVFSLSEMASQAQIFGYENILSQSNCSIEDILHITFTSAFPKMYGFAENACFSVSPQKNAYLQKVRLLAPEFESILKQYKLFVEEGQIDFELLQISSAPVAIKDIPSLNKNKYVYFNTENSEIVGCFHLFFSDQVHLTYVDPFKEEGKYSSFFDLIIKEKVRFDNYASHQKTSLNYLIDKSFIYLDSDGIIQVSNLERLLVLKDLHDNEFATFHRYSSAVQQEILQMRFENIVYFEDSLFSKPEVSYFNFHLNRSEFTNGLDLRNKYLHGTQANPEKIKTHQLAYFSYLKLIVLAMLKMDDDLEISQKLREQNENKLS